MDIHLYKKSGAAQGQKGPAAQIFLGVDEGPDMALEGVFYYRNGLGRDCCIGSGLLCDGASQSYGDSSPELSRFYNKKIMPKARQAAILATYGFRGAPGDDRLNDLEKGIRGELGVRPEQRVDYILVDKDGQERVFDNFSAFVGGYHAHKQPQQSASAPAPLAEVEVER